MPSIVTGNIQIQTSVGATSWGIVTTTNIGALGNIQAVLSTNDPVPTPQSFRVDLLPAPLKELEFQYSISTTSSTGTRYYWTDDGSGNVECNSTQRPSYNGNGAFIMSGTEPNTDVTIMRGDAQSGGVGLAATETSNTYNVVDNLSCAFVCQIS